MAAKKKKKKKEKGLGLSLIRIGIFVLVGFMLGGLVAYFYYGNLFRVFVTTQRDYITQDWSKVEYYANRASDQVIELKKMLEKDNVKHKEAPLDGVTDIRSRLIGADNVKEKVELLGGLEKSLNEVMEFYNKRMDLRNKRFGYIEWGMITSQYIEEYNDYKARYIESALEFNDRISRFPFKGTAKKEEIKPFPVSEGGGLKHVKVNTEEYSKDKIYRMDKLEDSSSAGSY